MAVHQYTSPGGAVYEFEGPDELTPELQKQIQESVALNESDTNQGPLATFGNAAMQGLAQTATGTVGGVGAVINTLTGSTGEDRSGLSTWADEMQRGAELNFPTNPANPIATGLGQAVGQGVGMMGTSALGLPLGNAKTVARLGLGMAGLMGAQQGEQVADEFGITDPLKRAAMVGGFGAIEGATEAFGGIGSTKFAKSLLKDVPSVLESGIESSAIKRGLNTAVGEGSEEVVSGELQDITTVALASEDPNNPGYSLNGQPLPELASMSTLQNRGQEFLYGMAGGLVPGGVNAAFGTDAGNVMEYRQAVAEKRRDGKVLPEEDERVTQLDAKAQEYLRKAGISDEDQASAILAHLQRADKTRDIVVEAADQASATAPSVSEALSEILEQTDRDAVLKDVDAAVQAIEPKPVVEEEKPEAKEVSPKPGVEEPILSPTEDGAFEGMFPSKESAEEWITKNRNKFSSDTLISSKGKHYIRVRFKDEVNEAPPSAAEDVSKNPPTILPLDTSEELVAPVVEEPSPTNEAEQREAPTVEPVSAEEAPEPVVEEPTTVPVAEPDPVVEEPTPPAQVTPAAQESYEPEPLPEGATLKKDNRKTYSPVSGEYTTVSYADAEGNKVTRAYFTNDPGQTFKQIAAGLEIPVPQGTKTHPDIKVAGGKVIGVMHSVNGRKQLVMNRGQAHEVALNDDTAAQRSAAQRPAAEKRKAATFAKKAELVSELPPFPGESTFADQALRARIKATAAKIPNLSDLARDNLESDILAKLVEIKRVGSFIESQPGETTEEKKQSALASAEVNGNKALEKLVSRYDPSQEDNLSYIQDLVYKASADSKKTLRTESLDDPETGVTADVADTTEEPDEELDALVQERIQQLPEAIRPAVLKDSNMQAVLARMSPETWEARLKSLSNVKAEQIKPGYRSVRAIMEESDRLGLKDGQPKSILTALQRIAENKTGDHYHPHIVYVARALSRLTDSLSKIQDLRFGTANTQHAATYRASDHSITLNLGTPWGEQQTVGEILVHEVGHALTSIKLNDPQTEYDKALAGEIESMRQQISDYLTNVRPADAESFAYQLSNADEFVAGVFSNPPFVEMLASLPERLVAGTPVSTKSNFFTNLLRKLWNLMLGKSVTPGSPMERAMDAVFSLAETPFTIPTAENVLSWASIEKNFPAYHGSSAAPSSKESLPINDEPYLAAVERGDMDTAQRLVDEAAKRAGYDKLYSGGVVPISKRIPSEYDFTVPYGWHLTNERQHAERAGGSHGSQEPAPVETVFVRKGRIANRETEFRAWQRKERNAGRFTGDEGLNESRKAFWREHDFDSVEYTEDTHPKGTTYKHELTVRSLDQIKSADPVMRDVDGKVIPLSQRFNLDSAGTLSSSAAPSSKESLPGEHRELIVEAMRALPAGYTLNTDTSSDSPVWVRRSRPGVIFANPGILAAEVAGMNPGRRAELLRSFIEEEVAHTEDLKELGDDEARRIARELAPETRAWINDMYGQDLNDIETVFEGFRMLRQRMRNGATTEEIRAFAASDPNFARRFLEYLRRMWKRLMANLDQDKTLANIKAVRSLVGGIDTLESLAVGEDDTKLGVYIGPKANISEKMRQGLAAAQAMFSAGKSTEEIRALTGWFPGIGKGNEQLRYEVPDAGAKMTRLFATLPVSQPLDGEAGTIALEEALDHPLLFAAYPQLKTVRVAKRAGFLDLRDQTRGSFNAKTNILSVSPSNKAPVGTILHEVQHWIQTKEGTAPGGNLNSVYAEADAPRQARIKAATDARDKARAEEEALRGGPRQAHDEAVARWSNSVAAVYAAMDEKAPPRLPEEKEWDYYNRIAGEIEARDVTDRSSLSKEQLAEVSPYSLQNVSPEDAIVLRASTSDSVLHASPWAWIREQVKPTAGTVTSHRTKAPWFATQDENTPYTATGVMFGSGRKNVSIAEAERVKNAINTAEGRALTVLDRDIKAAAVKTMGSWDAAKALVGEAIGNNENRMDYDQRKQYERDHTTAAKAALATYQSSLGTALALENKGDYAQAASVRQAAQSKFKTEVALAKDDFDHKIAQAEQLARQQALARQAAAMAALPTELREAVQRARDRMDALTTEFINKGYGSDDLRATLSKNLGLYLHRSYSAFESPHWAKWVMGKNPEAVRLRNKVETLVKVDLTTQKAADLIKENPALSHKDAITRAEGLLNDNEIEAKIQELLENSPDEYTSLVQGDGFKNGKPSSVIKRRGEIHPWIQEFWGKHDDPLLNISKSIGLTHAYLAQQSMLRSILNDGVANGYIFDDVGKARGLVPLKDKTEENMRRYPSLFRKDADGKIIGEWFVSPLVKDAIKDLEPESPAKSDSFKAKLWDAYRSLTGYSMAAKTVYSPMALVRDFLSNITILAIHGHMTPGFAAGPSTWAKSLAANAREVGLDQMLSAIMSPVRGKAPVFTNEQMKKLDALLSRSDELGITGNQMTTSVIKELTKEHSKRFDLRGKDVNRLLKALSSGLHNTAEFFMEWRALSDDIPKLVAWVNETLRTSQFHPEMTQARAEEAAAKKVRMVMPTYSETSDFIKGWRKQPFFSPFVTFSGEIVRTMINTYKLGAMEMKSTSTAEKLLGFHRIAGMTAMITVLPAIIQSALAKFRPEDDPPVKTDELATALPRFVSGWQKENMLLWLGKEGNKHTYLDLSYLAPYDVIHGILNGTARELFTNPDNVTIPGKVSAALEKAFNEAIKPVAKEQLLTGAIIDTLRNQREPGDKFGLYNDKLATSWEKWTASLSNIWQQALEPGIVKSLRGVVKGLNEEVDSSGRAYETWNEVRSIFGAKTMSQDIPTRLMRNGNGYARDLSDATMYASQPFSSAGTQDDESLIKAFARMNEAKLKVVGEIRKDWLAAQALGMTAEEATKSLSISHLPKDMVAAAISNEYVREPLSKQLLEKAATNGQALGQDRMALYRQAVEAYPAKQKVLNY